MVHDGTGSATSFVCRYHGWVFETDGTLRRCAGLRRARTRGGVLALGAVAGERLARPRVRQPRRRARRRSSTRSAVSPSQTEGFEIEQLVPAGEWHHDLACNWKTYAENYLEGYHIPIVHRELARSIDVAQLRGRRHDDWCLHRAAAKDGTVLDGRWLWRWPNLALNLYRDSMNLELFVPLGPR